MSEKISGWLAVVAGALALLFDGLTELVSVVGLQVDVVAGALAVAWGAFHVFRNQVLAVFKR